MSNNKILNFDVLKEEINTNNVVNDISDGVQTQSASLYHA